MRRDRRTDISRLLPYGEPTNGDASIRDVFEFPLVFDAMRGVLEEEGLIAPGTWSPELLRNALGGRYRIIGEIGRGAMAVVYMAYETALDRIVALKLLPAAHVADAVKRRRILSEARTAARLYHPNIVPVHAVEEAGALVFFTMEYVEGETLAERVALRGPLPVGEATRILHDVSRAVGYAHRRGVFHRDLKPDNIMIESGTGRVVVMDFGIAQAAPGRSDSIVGNAPFMSPEVARGADGDARADVFALGVTAWFAVTGHVPFEGKTLEEVLTQHVAIEVPRLHLYGEHLDATYARAVARCLEKNPNARFDDGDQLATELAKAPEIRHTDLAVPLRAFVDRSMRYAVSMRGASVAWVATLIAFLDALRLGRGAVATVTGAVLALTAAAGMTLLTAAARRAFKKGYTRADIIHALSVERERERELHVFQHGTAAPWIVQNSRALAYAGLGFVGVGALLLAFLGNLDPTIGLFTMVGGLAMAMGAGIASHLSTRHRRDRLLGRWLEFWKGRIGGLVARVAAVGLRRGA